jgi:hypothetical protein
MFSSISMENIMKQSGKKIVPSHNVRTRAINIISHIPIPKQNARSASSEHERFLLFFYNVILDLSLTLKIFVFISFNKISADRETMREELQTLMGLLLLLGMAKSRNLSQ